MSDRVLWLVVVFAAAALCFGCDLGSGALPDAGVGGGGDGDLGGVSADLAVASADLAPGGGCGTGAPITGAAPEIWSWVPFPDSICGRGTTTGIAINPTSKSNQLLIYLQGGGACYDANNCAPGCNPQQQLCAMNLDGFDQTHFAQQEQMFAAGTVFDRSAAANPFRDYNWVFVPYCTGDFHTGSTVASYGIHHMGYANLTAYLKRIVPTFCAADRVVLSGSSAGGFGAVFNYAHVRGAFPAVRVDLLDDSGPPLSTASMPLQTTMRAAWGAAANDPPACAACASGWDHWMPWIASTWPDARISLLSSLADVSIGPGFGGPIASPQGFRGAINAYADTVVAPLVNARVYYVDEYNHVYLKENLTTEMSLGVSLGGFLTKQVTGDPTWASVRP